MKYLFQFMIIGCITFIGEMLNYFVPLPIPASVYGLVLLFTALCLRIIKLEQVEETADFLLAVMPVMFVPAAVSLMTRWGLLGDSIWQFVLTCIVTTVLVMGITGITAQKLMALFKAGKEEQNEGDA